MKTPWTSELSRVVFLELRREITLGDLTLPKGFALPILYEEMEEKVLAGDSGDFTSTEVLRGILLLYGLDEHFRDREVYASIVSHLESQAGDLFKYFFHVAQTDEKLAFLLSLGYYHLGLSDAANILFTAELADNLYRESEDEKISDLAYALYRQAHSLDPTWQSHFHLAYHTYNRELYTKALEHIAASYDRLPTPELQTEMANLLALSEQKLAFHEGKELFFKERFEEAVIKFHSLEEEFPGWYQLHFFLGVSYRMLQQYSKALTSFYRALSLRRDDPQLYNEMAICHLMLEEPFEAEPLIEAALQLDENNPELLCNRAIVFLRTDRLKEAKEDLLKARSLDPNEPLYRDWLEHVQGKETDRALTH